MNKDEIVNLICSRLKQDQEKLRIFYAASNSNGPHWFSIDDLLPLEIAMEAFGSFPQASQMRELKSFREHKFTTKDFRSLNPVLEAITYAIQDKKVIEMIGQITGSKDQEGDPHLYAGGLSLMLENNFLNPHLDNSHNHDLTRYRTANLLYYVTPDWQESFGGNLEIWDKNVNHGQTILSKFNRLVFMETNRSSWHSVSPVKTNLTRCCISNYYFSKNSPEMEDYFHVTSFSARPEQKIRRVISKLDNRLRHLVRYFKKDGIGKQDLFQKT